MRDADVVKEKDGTQSTTAMTRVEVEQNQVKISGGSRPLEPLRHVCWLQGRGNLLNRLNSLS